jgi:hypothetical protein
VPRRRAAPPRRRRAAIDVASAKEYDALSAVESTSAPGANRSTAVGLVLEKDATPSTFVLAPTQITSAAVELHGR